MVGDHWCKPEKIKARCHICGKKLKLLYNMLGEPTMWVHKAKRVKHNEPETFA
jgi:hypothetical protein